LAAGAESSVRLAFISQASSPPLCSTVRRPAADTLRRIERPSTSEISVTLCKFGRNLRLVLRFEWLTLWPDWTAFSVRAQRRDMVEFLMKRRLHGQTDATRGLGPRPSIESGSIGAAPMSVKARRLAARGPVDGSARERVGEGERAWGRFSSAGRAHHS